ncbi:MAG: pirin family protein [Leptospirillum sp.]
MHLPPPNKIVDAMKTLEGGGFPVRRPFPTSIIHDADPFLLLDHMGPVNWGKGEAVGAPDHPHKGFETVTYLLEGEMEHKDSRGHSGKMGPMDLQWMTAGSGLLHSELPSPRFLEQGGVMNGFQIWINLPAKLKNTPPHYQEISRDRIPSLQNNEKTGLVKILAGEQSGVKSPINTLHKVFIGHIILDPEATISLLLSPEDRTLLYVFKGSLSPNGDKMVIRESQMALWDPDANRSDKWTLKSTKEGVQALVLSSPPIGEPVARYGPFVMNTMEEIREAIEEYRSGKWGDIN